MKKSFLLLSLFFVLVVDITLHAMWNPFGSCFRKLRSHKKKIETCNSNRSEKKGKSSVKHLGIIPDGNRRWAKQNKLKTALGYEAGMKAVEGALATCIEHGIQYLSVYLFSLENLKRPEKEKNFLFNKLLKKFKSKTNRFVEEKISLKFLGDRSKIPASVLEDIEEMEKMTQNGDRLQVNLLFCYGSQQEMVHATKKIAKLVQEGVLDLKDISIDTIKKYLWTGNIPDLDLIIRTSGAQRLSNFLLFQSAYSEFTFPECLWPDVTKEVLSACIEEFVSRQRNFGK